MIVIPLTVDAGRGWVDGECGSIQPPYTRPPIGDPYILYSHTNIYIIYIQVPYFAHVVFTRTDFPFDPANPHTNTYKRVCK